MIDVFFFSDREVTRKLLERVEHGTRPMVVVQVHQDRFSRPVPEREPFATLERRYGDLIDLVVAADEGSSEGMWRDPMGELADRFFPDDRQAAYQATSGYLVIAEGEVKAVLKKQGAPAEDLAALQEALSRIDHRIPPPRTARRTAPPHARQEPEPEPQPRHRHREPPRARRVDTPPPAQPAPPAPMAADPWTLLGIARGTPLPEAKKAFRALIAQYHPDKVSHLAPEFRTLAELRTREILDAWQQVEAELEG